MGARVGILGGAFDPIHIGHLIVGQEVLHRCRLDRVLFLPSSDPPHKRGQEMAPAEVRAEMVELAVADNPLFELSRIEFERPGKSYTVDTLKILRQRLGDDVELFLAIGADSAIDMPTWCDLDGVLDLAHVTVVGRPGFERRRIDPVLARRMRFLNTPLLEVSSTDIRARVRAGKPIRYLVCGRVLCFIEELGLYR